MLAVLFCVVAGSALAQQSPASEKLNEAFVAILRKQITEFVMESGQSSQMTSQKQQGQIETLVKQANEVYAPVMLLSEAEANKLLTSGPDDKVNSAAINRDIDLWRKVQLPMPALYRKMQDSVVAGKIHGGLELELTRRISEFHLKQLKPRQP